MKILTIVSSTNENKKLAEVLNDYANNLKQETQTINLVGYDLPLYDMEKEVKDGIPIPVYEIIEQMEKADAFIVVAPEYNGSVPPVLSNAIAWISRTNENFRALFSEKAILLATHSGSGGIDLMQSMRIQFTKLGAIVIPRQIITTYQTKLVESTAIHCIEQLIRINNKG